MSFRFEPTEIPDVVLVRPTRYRDARGSFAETYRRSAFREAGLGVEFVQDNVARSGPRVLRGLHFQRPPRPQGKLVWVRRGSVFDVAVDLRRGGPTFGRWIGRTLDEEEGAMLWIPPGFAHGYVALGEGAEVAYKVTEEWDGALDDGIRWNDPDIGVQWPVPDPVLSEKDRALPLLAEEGSPFGIGAGG